MIVELQEHHIAEIREKIDKWPASKLNAKDLRDDIRKLLDHIEWQAQELKEAQETLTAVREWGRHARDGFDEIPRL